MFDDATRLAIDEIARTYEIEPAALLAVAEVESGGRAFATVNGKPEPLIRWEGHYFDRRLSGTDREDARDAGLSSPIAGAIANPTDQARRWHMLEAAAKINRKAAYESASYGIGQVMGAHWAWLGYADVESLVAEARSGVAGQVRLMARFVEKAGLIPSLKAHDWTAFARGYNGPAQKGYDKKIATAYAKYAKTAPAKAALSVKDIQSALNAFGYGLKVDGIDGPKTKAAVRDFQEKHGLTVDGIVGPKTWTALSPRVSFMQTSSDQRTMGDYQTGEHGLDALLGLGLEGGLEWSSAPPRKEDIMNSNAIHNVLNIVIWGLGLIAVVLVYAGCTQLPNGSLDCSTSTIVPPSWLPWIVTITTGAAGLKTLINYLRDGLAGMWKEQPPVKK